MWRATLKSLLGRKVRLLLTALSVVLGVGFIAGTYVLTDTMNAAFDELFSSAAESSDVVVRARSAFTGVEAGPGGGGSEERDPLPAALVDRVQGVEGVARATGSLTGYAQMVDPATGDEIGGFGPPTIGTNWTGTGGSSAIVVRAGAPPEGPDEVMVDAGTAERFAIGVGDRIKVLFESVAPREFVVSGTAGFGDADNLGGATLAVFDTATAQEVLNREGVVDTIDVVAAEGVQPDDLRARVAAVLPAGVEAVTSTTVADENSEALKEGLGFFRTFLLVFALIALFVGSFIIFNTFSIIVAQRSKELALLRALGASRRQVLASVIIEAVVVGLIASLVGLVAGIGISYGLQGLLGLFNVDLPSTSTQLLPRTVVVSVVVGVAVTAVASILPALRASRVAPIEALRDAEQPAIGAGLGRRLTIGLVVAGLGIAALLYGLFGTPTNAAALVGLGAAVTFVGVAMLSPLAARPVAGALGRPIARRAIQGKLGRENAMRNPRRTASTASALMIGLGLVAMVSVLASSLTASTDAALAATLKADFTLTTTSFNFFSQDVAARVREVPDVAAVAEFRQGGFKVNGTTAYLTAVDPATVGEVAELDVSAGGFEALAAGDVLVHTDVAEENGWSVGDRLPAAFATRGDVELEVGGTFAERRLVGVDYLISLDAYDGYFTEELDAFVMVKAAPGADTSVVQREITGALGEDYPNIDVQDQAEYREKQATFVNQLLGLVQALLAMAILIALFGIVNTLGLSIFERRRELGLLRAVGMSRTQVRRMIRWEAVIISVFGALLGVTIGIVFGWALQQALVAEGVTEFRLPVPQLVVYLVLAGIAGVLAAIGPARRAAKLNVLQSISYE
jgi:putative ABC transport system permease protein